MVRHVMGAGDCKYSLGQTLRRRSGPRIRRAAVFAVWASGVSERLRNHAFLASGGGSHKRSIRSNWTASNK